jgi:hypothetical protein
MASNTKTTHAKKRGDVQAADRDKADAAHTSDSGKTKKSNGVARETETRLTDALMTDTVADMTVEEEELDDIEPDDEDLPLELDGDLSGKDNLPTLAPDNPRRVGAFYPACA